MSNKFLSIISAYISRNGLLNKDQHHIVALSGGADSVSLLVSLKALGYDISAAHCNFHLRGEESDRDEKFCISLCDSLQVNLHVVHFDTEIYAQLHKVSIEMAARELRYNYFEKLRVDIAATDVCVAHHQDDSVETLLINLTRGTGLNGLTGILPRNGHIVRPMLCVSRDDILVYLKDLGQDYITDSTNLIDDVTRNKIRLNVLPLLEEINPSAKSNIAKTAFRLSEALKIFNNALQKTSDEIVAHLSDGCDISISGLLNTVSPEYTLFFILKDYGFSPSQIEQMANNLNADSGRLWQSKTHELVVNRGILLVRPIDPILDKEMRIPECGIYLFTQTCKFNFTLSDMTDAFSMSKLKDVVDLDGEDIKFPLKLRHTNNGDRFVPLGLHKGSKLVSDYLTDCKKSLFDKRNQLVVTDADGTIIWLVGERIDERFKITDKTNKILTIKRIITL